MSAAVRAELMSPDLLAQLERVQLRTRRRLAGRFAGEHRSPDFGTSVDFADYREYHPGDDFRRIDYPLYARTGNLFIRLFEAEDDVTVRIMLDRSASMGMHGKLDQAVRMAAAIGFVALIRRDTVIVHTLPPTTPGSTTAAPRRFSGRHATQPLFDMLGGIEAAGPTDLISASQDVLTRQRRGGVTVLVSDLLTDGWSTAVDRLAASGSDVNVLHVLATEELHPDHQGDLDMIDVETGATVPTSLSPATLREYSGYVTAWLTETSSHCRARGASYQQVLADAPPEGVLLRAWREHGLVR
ncbi:hypothetical protein BH24ACT5_BH24ACT5_03090 [soil metagenome]